MEDFGDHSLVRVEAELTDIAEVMLLARHVARVAHNYADRDAIISFENSLNQIQTKIAGLQATARIWCSKTAHENATPAQP